MILLLRRRGTSLKDTAGLRERKFAQFLKIASLFETRNHLLDARDRGYITSDEQYSADILARRAISAATGLRSYLLSPRNTVSKGRTYKRRNAQ